MKYLNKILQKIKHLQSSENNFYNKPIYHVHIRKTGGTSLNESIINAISNPVLGNLKQLEKEVDYTLRVHGNKITGWNKKAINKCDYSFAFSHIPFYQLSLNKECYVFTCFRDPAKRVISHYNMLLHFKENEIAHQCMIEEGKWVDGSFEEYLNKIDKKELLNQLYMFSEKFNVDEALCCVSKLNLITKTELFKDNLKYLSSTLNLKLEEQNKMKINHIFKPNNDQIEELKHILKDEYEFMNKVEKLPNFLSNIS